MRIPAPFQIKVPVHTHLHVCQELRSAQMESSNYRETHIKQQDQTQYQHTYSSGRNSSSALQDFHSIPIYPLQRASYPEFAKLLRLYWTFSLVIVQFLPDQQLLYQTEYIVTRDYQNYSSRMKRG